MSKISLPELICNGPLQIIGLSEYTLEVKVKVIYSFLASLRNQ